MNREILDACGTAAIWAPRPFGHLALVKRKAYTDMRGTPAPFRKSSEKDFTHFGALRLRSKFHVMGFLPRPRLLPGLRPGGLESSSL